MNTDENIHKDNRCAFCKRHKLKNAKTKLMKVKQPAGVDIDRRLRWCHEACKKSYETRLSREKNVPYNENPITITSSRPVPNLREILSKDGLLGLHKYQGPFTYTHVPQDALQYLEPEEQTTQKILAQKTLYEIFSMLHPDHAQKTSTDPIELCVKNVCSTKPLTFVQTIRAVKNVHDLKTKRAAKKRAKVLPHIIDNLLVNKNDAGKQDVLFSRAPKHIAKKLNTITSAAAEVNIHPFEASTLAALEEKLGLSYRQSTMLRYFLKAQGAGELFGPGCSEKKVREAKRVAGNSIEYKVGTVNVFNNNGNSNVTTEVCFMAVKSFDAALAWIVADMDSRRTYRSLNFIKAPNF